MLLGRKCGTCGARGLRACGARAGEMIGSKRGGYYRWSKWNPCSEFAPGGLRPGVEALPECGDLDEVRGVDGIPEFSDSRHVIEVR